MSWWRPRSKPDRAGLMKSTVRKHRAALVRFVFGIARDEALANDIVQEALLRLWNDDGVTDEEHAKRWLYRTSRNLTLDRIKQRHRRNQIMEDYPQGPLPLALAEDPLELLEAGELQDLFLRRLEALPPRQREVLELRLDADLSYREIADVLETTTSNVGVLLHKALTRLRLEMSDAGEPATPTSSNALVGQKKARPLRKVVVRIVDSTGPHRAREVG